MKSTTEAHDHLDPITGEPGAHPVGAGVGAAVGSAAVGVLGALAGPVGALVGAAVGGIVGGLTGKGFAEGYDPTAEDAYWRAQHPQQPYASEGRDYDVYARAYRTGHGGYQDGKGFEDREAELRLEYEGGPQKADAERAAEADDVDATGETVEDNLHTRPLLETEVGTAPTRAEDYLKGQPLAWQDAREAARAAYERRRLAMEARLRAEQEKSK